jgi:hypothetical protein
MCVVETRARCGDVHAAGATFSPMKELIPFLNDLDKKYR